MKIEITYEKDDHPDYFHLFLSFSVSKEHKYLFDPLSLPYETAYIYDDELFLEGLAQAEQVKVYSSRNILEKTEDGSYEWGNVFSKCPASLALRETIKALAEGKHYPTTTPEQYLQSCLISLNLFWD